MKRQTTAVASALALTVASNVSASPARDAVDERELAAIRARSPHALELLETAESLVAERKPAEAEPLLQQSHTEFPEASILWRRDCEVLTALGRRADAINACSYAVGAYRSGINVRALVSALVDGPSAPTTGELSLALSMTATEHTKGPSLTVAAAACDIAERMGDPIMLQGCAQELLRIAPDDPATQRAMSVLSTRCPPWRFWTGWGAIVGVCIATAGHALGRRARGRSVRRRYLAAAGSLSLVLASWSNAAGAQEPRPSGNWLGNRPVDDRNPDSNIPTEAERNADPLQFGYWLQDVALKGEHASKRGDHAAAAKFYDALAKAVPDRAVGFAKACEEYEATGDRERAISRCGDALLRDGLRVEDYTHFVHLVVGKPGPLSDTETAALDHVASHMRTDPAGRPFADELECEVATRTSNLGDIRECTAALMARAPDDSRTISYSWALAVAEGRTRDADTLVVRATAAGVRPEDIQRMKRATADGALVRSLRISAFVVAIGLLLAGLAMGILGLRALWTRRRLAANAA